MPWKELWMVLSKQRTCFSLGYDLGVACVRL